MGGKLPRGGGASLWKKASQTCVDESTMSSQHNSKGLQYNGGDIPRISNK